MAVIKQNARGWIFEISDGATTPTYTQILGIKTFAHGYESTDTDTTTFASLGMKEQEVMERGQTLSVEGFFLEDASKNRDPGQSQVETLAEAVGAASQQTIRLTSPQGKKYAFLATAVLGDQGGASNDKTTWKATFKRSGATTIS